MAEKQKNAVWHYIKEALILYGIYIVFAFFSLIILALEDYKFWQIFLGALFLAIEIVITAVFGHAFGVKSGNFKNKLKYKGTQSGFSEKAAYSWWKGLLVPASFFIPNLILLIVGAAAGISIIMATLSMEFFPYSVILLAAGAVPGNFGNMTFILLFPYMTLAPLVWYGGYMLGGYKMLMRAKMLEYDRNRNQKERF